MDKKSILLGILFMGGGLALMMYNSMREQEAKQAALEQRMAAEERALSQQVVADDYSTPAITPPRHSFEGVDPQNRTTPAASAAAPSTDSRPAEERPQLENDHLRISFSTYSGAIDWIELTQFPSRNPHYHDNPAPVRLNRVSEDPALQIARSQADQLTPLVAFYTVESATRDSITFVGELPGNIQILRTYTLTNEGDSGPAPYTIRHETTFRNLSDAPFTLDRLYLNIGTAAPSDADRMGYNLNASYFDNGDYETIAASKFRGGGIIFKSAPKDKIEERGILQWASVKNQFFTTILTPDSPADAIVARGVRFPADPRSGEIPIGVTAEMEFLLPTIQPGASAVIAGDLYAGPKEFSRLSKMGMKQEDVLQLGWFIFGIFGIIGFVGKMLLLLMTWMHGIAGNWGVAIILTTFVIRLILYPLTAKAARASKRMQKLSKPLQDIREKYKDNPQKLNEEMMNLWKRHKINPLSGCWPVLLQFPIFIAFFNLLRSSSELRFAEFLWITDLSMPDATIPLGDTYIPYVGSAINVLPFVWLVSMWFQMKMMPSPSMDNAQARIIKWMPFIFFPFTYIFSSGLVLYWTTTNCFSILQQWMTNRVKDEEDVAIEEEIAAKEQKKKAPIGPLLRKKKKKKPEENR